MTSLTAKTPASLRKTRANSSVWKSGLLALSLATVVGGTAMLGKADAVQQVAAQQPESQMIVVEQQPSGQLLVRRDVPTSSSFGAASRSFNSVPAMPQQPVFRQPITRTRGS